MKLLFEINEQTIVRKDEKKVVADSRNYLQASFTFSAEWTGVKTAVFKRESEVYNVTLENDMCYVPWQVLNGQGYFNVSAFCGDLITANMGLVRVGSSGYILSEEPPPPDPLEVYIKSYAGDNGVRYFKYENEELSFLSSVGEWAVVSGGKSAYEIAILNGFEGTEQEWLDSLHGKDGTNGKDGANAKNIEVQVVDRYVQWRLEGGEWVNLIEIPKINHVAAYSLTTLIDGVSAELRVNPITVSKVLAKYAVFADAENVSGILPISSGFVSLPVIFESNRITVNFYNEENTLTFTTVLNELCDFGILKHGVMNIKEGA